MRVELPKLLSVLAHEVRGPVGVIQGYVRLMLRQHEPADPNTPMLKAMLDATGRLTTLGRQASDLAVWLDDGARQPKRTSLDELNAGIVKVLTNARVTTDIPDAARAVTISTAFPGLLSAAIAAVAESVARESPEVPITIHAVGSEDTAVTFLIGPTAAVTSLTPRRGAVADGAGSMSFESGGLGLSLVLASYVLEGHGAAVSAAADTGVVEVRLPQAGGTP